jgi:hypothetical protein
MTFIETNKQYSYMRKAKSTLLFLSVFTFTGVFGQNESQDVVKNFDAKLLESEKVRVNPVLPPVDTTTKAQSYTVPNKVLVVDYQPPRLRPVGMATEKIPPQYNGYAKLGYGFPNSPYGELAYRYGNPKQYLVGLNVKHHSAEDKKLENQRFSKTGVALNGTFFANAGIAVDGKLSFDNDVNHYYGYRQVRDTSFNREAVKQAFNTFGASVKAYNSVRTVADFNYALGVSFFNLTDNFTSKESDFNIKLEATKWFAERHPLSIIVRTEFTKYDTADAGKSQTLNNFYVQPSFTFKGGVYSIKIGANLISHEDVFYPKPDIEANLNIAGNKLGIFAGVRGDFTKNSYRNLTKYNPFVFSRQRIENTDIMEYYGGIKGSLSGFDYSVQTGYSNNKNLALFLSDTTDLRRRFKVLYDTVGIFNVRGAITMRPTKDMELTATVSQNVYQKTKELAAWGLPSLDVNIGAKYTIINDPKTNTVASVKAGLFVQNGVNFINKDKQPDRLNGLFDLSLGGELFFSKNVGVFFDANNLLNLKRERWYNYPTFGLNILGGVTARF